MTPSQVKRLGEIALSAIPSDATKGYAEWLIDGEYRKRVSKALAGARTEWRQATTDVSSVADNRVPANKGGTLADRFGQIRTNYKEFIIYLGAQNEPYAVWVRDYKPQPEARSYFYHATSVNARLLEELVGGADEIYKGSYCLTPLQIFDLIQQKIISVGKQDYLFLIGHYKKRPLLMRVWQEESYCRFCEECWAEKENGADDVYLVFGKKLDL